MENKPIGLTVGVIRLYSLPSNWEKKEKKNTTKKWPTDSYPDRIKGQEKKS